MNWLNVPDIEPRKAKKPRKSYYKHKENPDAKKIIDETGRELLVYEKTGLVKDAKTGHVLNQPKGLNNIQTSERGRALANERHERVRVKARDEILRVTKENRQPGEPEIITHDDAYVVGVGRAWKKVILGEKSYPRDILDGLEKLGKIADFLPRERQPGELPENGFNFFGNISAEDLLTLAEGFRKINQEKKEHEQ